MACHIRGLIMAHMRSGLLKAYHVLGQITAQSSSGPLRGFGLNYGPYQIRPVNWTLRFWAHLLKAHLVIWPDISFGLLKACHIVGPNYGLVCIRPAPRRYLIGPNKDRDNHGSGSIAGCCRPMRCSACFRPNLLLGLLKAH